MGQLSSITRGQWLTLTAALLGWLFDGFEMGVFPIVARPALRDLPRVRCRNVIGLVAAGDQGQTSPRVVATRGYAGGVKNRRTTSASTGACVYCG